MLIYNIRGKQKTKNPRNISRTRDGSTITLLVAVRRPVTERRANFTVGRVYGPLAVIVICAQTIAYQSTFVNILIAVMIITIILNDRNYRCYDCDGNCLGTCHKCTSNVVAPVDYNRPAFVSPRRLFFASFLRCLLLVPLCDVQIQKRRERKYILLVLRIGWAGWDGGGVQMFERMLS